MTTPVLIWLLVVNLETCWAAPYLHKRRRRDDDETSARPNARNATTDDDKTVMYAGHPGIPTRQGPSHQEHSAACERGCPRSSCRCTGG